MKEDIDPDISDDEVEILDETQQAVRTLLLKDGRTVCDKCSGNHDTESCFRKTGCSHCGDSRHTIINCFKLCKCRMLLAFRPDLKGIPHLRSEACTIDWDVLLDKLINDKNPLN